MLYTRPQITKLNGGANAIQSLGAGKGNSFNDANPGTQHNTPTATSAAYEADE